MHKKQVYGSDIKQVYKSSLWHKFDTRILKTKRTYNPFVRFSKYIVILIFLVEMLTISYNQVFNQTLFNVYLLFLCFCNHDNVK